MTVPVQTICSFARSRKRRAQPTSSPPERKGAIDALAALRICQLDHQIDDEAEG